MPISPKSWVIVGGAATAIALAPLAASAAPSVLDEPVGSRGVVVAAAPMAPGDGSSASADTTAPTNGPTVSPASPQTPGSATASPVTPASPVTATSPVTPASPVSPAGPTSPVTPN